MNDRASARRESCPSITRAGLVLSGVKVLRQNRADVVDKSDVVCPIRGARIALCMPTALGLVRHECRNPCRRRACREGPRADLVRRHSEAHERAHKRNCDEEPCLHHSSGTHLTAPPFTHSYGLAAAVPLPEDPAPTARDRSGRHGAVSFDLVESTSSTHVRCPGASSNTQSHGTSCRWRPSSVLCRFPTEWRRGTGDCTLAPHATDGFREDSAQRVPAPRRPVPDRQQVLSLDLRSPVPAEAGVRAAGRAPGLQGETAVYARQRARGARPTHRLPSRRLRAELEREHARSARLVELTSERPLPCSRWEAHPGERRSSAERVVACCVSCPDSTASATWTSLKRLHAHTLLTPALGQSRAPRSGLRNV